MKKILLTLALAVAGAIAGREASACTNFIITRGASTDGSIMVTYAADSHQLYGCLYTPSKRAAAMMPVYEWDTGKYLGDIPQAEVTYSTVGNMNEHSLIITETTFGGREELVDPEGRVDYGSLIYIWLTPTDTHLRARASR